MVKDRRFFYLQFEDIKRTNYAMDKNSPNYFTIINKATYFTNVSKSFAEMIKNMTDKSFLTHEGDLRRIVQGFVDVSSIRKLSF